MGRFETGLIDHALFARAGKVVGSQANAYAILTDFDRPILYSMRE